MQLWRIATDTPEYASDDLTGAGARATGGRWNRKGSAVLYASSNRALAVLESFARLTPRSPLPLNRYLVEIVVPDAEWRRRTVFDSSANVGWDAEPAGVVSLNWGTAWIAGASSLLAVVPSVIVAEELNVLINPAHARMAGVTLRKVRKWMYDPRLAGK